MNATTKPISEAEQIAKLTRDLELANRKIRLLEEMLRLARIKKYGAASEKLDNRQLNLLELEPGVSNVEVEAESRREPLSREPRKKRPHPVRDPDGRFPTLC